MDESPRQLIKETRIPVQMKAGQLKKEDFEYQRCGTCNVFMANEPLAGKRFVKITKTKTKLDWAYFIKEIVDHYYADAPKITLVMDNLNTHKAGSLYEAFKPEEAKKIRDRLEFVYTPKHGSWLNMAEIELNVLIAQCLNRRIDNIDTMRNEVLEWEKKRNQAVIGVNWQFTTSDARIKLKRLYPSILT